MKTPDMNYQDPILQKKQGFLSRIFRRKVKDDPLAPSVPYTREQIALMEKEKQRRMHDEWVMRQVAKQKVGIPADANDELYEAQMKDAHQFVDHGFQTPSHLVDIPTPTNMVTPQAIEQAAQISQLATPVQVTPSKLNKFINVAITAFAFIIGMVGVNIVYNQLPTYPMVTVGIVAIAVSAGIVTNMAR